MASSFDANGEKRPLADWSSTACRAGVQLVTRGSAQYVVGLPVNTPILVVDGEMVALDMEEDGAKLKVTSHCAFTFHPSYLRWASLQGCRLEIADRLRLGLGRLGRVSEAAPHMHCRHVFTPFIAFLLCVCAGADARGGQGPDRGRLQAAQQRRHPHHRGQFPSPTLEPFHLPIGLHSSTK